MLSKPGYICFNQDLKIFRIGLDAFARERSQFCVFYGETSFLLLGSVLIEELGVNWKVFDNFASHVLSSSQYFLLNQQENALQALSVPVMRISSITSSSRYSNGLYYCLGLCRDAILAKSTSSFPTSPILCILRFSIGGGSPLGNATVPISSVYSNSVVPCCTLVVPCSTLALHCSTFLPPKVLHSSMKLRSPFPAVRPFTSSTYSIGLNSEQSDGQECHPASNADKVHETILSNSGAHQDMEAALDLLGVELTTELVEDVIKRLQYEEKLAFRFFTWVGHQVGYTHEHQTFNDMIDILSSTRYKAKQFGIVCDVLDHMKRKSKYSVSVDALLEILKRYSEKHLTHVSKFVKKKRVRVKSQPEINAFNLFVDSLCKCSLVREAEDIVYRIKNKLTPDAHTYNILFFGWCRVRNPNKAMKVLEEMIQMGHPPENFTYNAAIDSFCEAGMLSEARELFEFMRKKGSTLSSPTAKTYSVMFVALAKAGHMEECFKLLTDMRNTGCLPDVSTYKELIEGMCMAGKIEEAYQILEDMGNKGYPPDILTYNCFLKVLCNLHKADEAIKLCERMTELSCDPSVHTYNMLITMFYTMGIPDRAFDMWQEMDKRQCQRDVDTYCIMIDGLFGCNRSQDALLLLEEVMDRGIKLPYRKYDTLLLKLSEIGNLRAIHRLSEHMKSFYNRAMARRYAITQKKKSVSLKRR